MNKGSRKNAPQKHEIKIYGMTDKMKNSLEEISYRKFGKASLSNTIKEIVKMYIVNYRNPVKTEYDPNVRLKSARVRMEIRISKEELEYLQNMAKLHETTSNQIVSWQIHNLRNRYPILSPAELNAVRLSNIRLLQIGRNINQIAKQLNAMQGVTLATTQLAQLQKTIDEHTETVFKLIRESKKRYQYTEASAKTDLKPLE